MGRVTSARPFLTEYEVSERLKQAIGNEQRRWLVVWNALVDPRPAKEIAKHTGVSKYTVNTVISKYNRFGPEAIESSKESKRRRCYLSKEEEAKFLEPFLEIAPTGEICVANQIRQALEELLGHGVHHSTVYRMLHRNGWREVVPRPEHPDGDKEKQEAFKKKFPNL